MTQPDPPESSLLRPYLNAGRRPEPEAPDAEPTVDFSVRSFTMTSGRSRATVQLAFESMLQTTPIGVANQQALTFERATIVEMCVAETLSVAELSARMHIPIGVVRVLAADLIAEQFLQAFVASTNVGDDVSLIARLIAGVRTL